MLTEQDITKALNNVNSDDLIISTSNFGFGKEATHKVSPNPAQWDIDVVHLLYKLHPFILPQYQIDVQWHERDDQQGYGFGAIILSSKARFVPYRNQRPGQKQKGIGSSTPEKRIAVPVIIKAFEVSPLDIFTYGGRFYPLTERRLDQAFKQPEMFTATDSAERTPYSDQGMVDMLAPPYEAAYGNYSRHGGGFVQGYGTAGRGLMSFSAEGMGKQGQILPGTVNDEVFLDRMLYTLKPETLEKWREHVSSYPSAIAAFERGGKLDVLRRASSAKPSTSDDEKDWVKRVLPKDLIRVTRLGGGIWCITISSDQYYDPMQINVPREEAVRHLVEYAPDIDARMRASEDFLIERDGRETTDPIVLEDLSVDVKPADTPGKYIVMTRRGEVLAGSFIPDIMDYDGSLTPWHLWSDGCMYALADVILGEQVPGEVELEEVPVRRGETATFLIDNSRALLPFTIRSCACADDHLVIRAFDHFKREVNFVVTPGVESMKSITGISDPSLGEFLDGNIWIVPDDWDLVALGRLTRLWDDPKYIEANLGWKLNNELVPNAREVIDGGPDPTIESHTVALRALSDGRYSLKGSILDYVTGTQRAQDVDPIEAKYLLASLGVSVADAEGLLDRANERKVIRVSNLKMPKRVYREKTAEITQLANRWNRDLFLEAASICEVKARLKNQSEKIADYLFAPFGKIAEGLFAPAEDSVEAVLGLGIVNEENLSDLLASIPSLQESESRLAELLLYTRLGLDLIPDQGISRALENLNAVLEELEMAWALMRGGFVQ